MTAGMSSRKVVVMMHTTLDGRIANDQGGFWEPFPWGAPADMEYTNAFFRSADTWVLGRVTYEGIVPWWDTVARGEVPAGGPDLTDGDHEFARIQKGLAKVVFSRSLASSDDRTVVVGDIAGGLAELKRAKGANIVVSCGPDTLSQLVRIPDLIDEYLIIVHPAVIAAGPRLFDAVERDLTLQLLGADTFEGGCVALRYRASTAAR